MREGVHGQRHTSDGARARSVLSHSIVCAASSANSSFDMKWYMLSVSLLSCTQANDLLSFWYKRASGSFLAGADLCTAGPREQKKTETCMQDD
jgi:hypothetical protein